MSECISQVQSFNYFLFVFDHWMQGPNLCLIDFNGIILYPITYNYTFIIWSPLFYLVCSVLLKFNVVFHLFQFTSVHLYLPFYSNTKLRLILGFRLYACVCIDLIFVFNIIFYFKREMYCILVYIYHYVHF